MAKTMFPLYRGYQIEGMDLTLTSMLSLTPFRLIWAYKLIFLGFTATLHSIFKPGVRWPAAGAHLVS